MQDAEALYLSLLLDLLEFQKVKKSRFSLKNDYLYEKLETARFW